MKISCYSLLLLALLLMLTAPVFAGKRVALLIGNAEYSVANGRLVNPINNARSLSKTLGNLGFRVLIKTNLPNREAMETAVAGTTSRGPCGWRTAGTTCPALAATGSASAY